MAIVNPVGTEFRVNTTVGAGRPTVAMLANGNFVITFDADPTRRDSDVRARVFDPAGAPVGNEFAVHPSVAAFQGETDITQLSNGSFVVTWNDDGVIKGRVFDSARIPQTDPFVISTGTDDHHRAQVSALDGGRFVVVWESGSAGSYEAGGAIFDSNGNRIGPEFALGGSDLYERMPAIATLSDGGFLVQWLTAPNEAAETDLHAQRYSASGSPLGSEIVVATGTSGGLGLDEPAIASFEDGGFVSAWRQVNQIRVQVFDADGEPVGQPVAVSSSTGQDVDVAVLSDGNFIVTWMTRTGPSPAAREIFARLFDSTGAPLGAEFVVNTTTAGAQDDPHVTALPGRGFVITWQTDDLQGGRNAAAQIFRYADGDGDSDANTLVGTAGNDELAGNGGNDTIYGASGNDRIHGGGGDDDVWAGDGNDRLESGAGIDELHGERGADRLFFYATMTSDDIADGGAGSDRLFLRGAYANLVFGATTMTGIETIRLAGGFDYRLTTHDATVANGTTLTVEAAGLGRNDELYFDGSAETGAGSRFVIDGGRGDDTIAGGAGGDVFHGGNGRDTLTGYAGNDTLAGGGNADRIELGGGGADTVVVDDTRHSSSRNHDTVAAFDANADRFDLPVTVDGIDTPIASGRLNESNFNADLAAAVNAARLAAGHAVLFTPDRGAHAGETFLIVDGNGIAGYQPLEDFVFRLEAAANLAGLTPGDFV